MAISIPLMNKEGLKSNNVAFWNQIQSVSRNSTMKESLSVSIYEGKR